MVNLELQARLSENLFGGKSWRLRSVGELSISDFQIVLGYQINCNLW